MTEDRLNKTISNVAYILDCLISLRQIQGQGNCNNCDNKKCGYLPEVGQTARYNCPFYVEKIEKIPFYPLESEGEHG